MIVGGDTGWAELNHKAGKSATRVMVGGIDALTRRCVLVAPDVTIRSLLAFGCIGVKAVKEFRTGKPRRSERSNQQVSQGLRWARSPTST